MGLRRKTSRRYSGTSNSGYTWDLVLGGGVYLEIICITMECPVWGGCSLSECPLSKVFLYSGIVGQPPYRGVWRVSDKRNFFFCFLLGAIKTLCTWQTWPYLHNNNGAIWSLQWFSVCFLLESAQASSDLQGTPVTFPKVLVGHCASGGHYFIQQVHSCRQACCESR